MDEFSQLQQEVVKLQSQLAKVVDRLGVLAKARELQITGHQAQENGTLHLADDQHQPYQQQPQQQQQLAQQQTAQQTSQSQSQLPAAVPGLPPLPPTSLSSRPPGAAPLASTAPIHPGASVLQNGTPARLSGAGLGTGAGHTNPPSTSQVSNSGAVEPPIPGPPPPAHMAATRVVMHQIVLPSEVDRLGICFGGQVLSWIDVCAGLSAKTLARGPCVTATLDAVHFLRPCRLGTVVIVAAMVNRTFNSSMEVGVKVEAEDMRTGVRHHCCSAYLTFVVVAPRGHGRISQSGTRPLQAHDAGVSRQPSFNVTSQPSQQNQPPQPNQQLQPPAVKAAAMPLLRGVVPTTLEHTKVHAEAEARRQRRLEERQRQRNDPQLAAQAELCRLRPITHRDGGPTLPPSIQPPWLFTPPLSSRPRPSSNGTLVPTTSQQPLDPDPATADKLSSTLDGPATEGLLDQQSGPVLSRAEGSKGSEALLMQPLLDRSNSSIGPRLPVSPSLTVAYMTQSIMPQHANTLGITFGGQVMSWMEMCAYISASRLRSPHLLTAAIDSLTFVRPTCVGDILYVTSQVTAIFGTSLEVQVSVHGEDPQVGELFHCADGYVTLVTVSAEDGPEGVAGGTPVQLPFTLAPATEAEIVQAQGAVRRRDERLKLRAAIASKERSM